MYYSANVGVHAEARFGADSMERIVGCVYLAVQDRFFLFFLACAKSVSILATLRAESMTQAGLSPESIDSVASAVSLWAIFL